MKRSRMRHGYCGLGHVLAALTAIACSNGAGVASEASLAVGSVALMENSGSNAVAAAQPIQFLPSSVMLPAMWYSSPAFGDFDGDGDLDLAIIGSEESGGYPPTDLPGIEILRNDGGAFTKQTMYPHGSPGEVYRGSVRWGDYDADGRADLFLNGGQSIFGGPRSIIYHNDGIIDGGLKFTTAYLDSGFGLDGDGAWGDFDGDGDLDLAYCGASAGGSGQTLIVRNDARTFVPLTTTLAPEGSCAISWVDFNRDGRLDLFVAGDGGSFLYRNDAGAFVDSGTQFPMVSGMWGGVAAAWADFDGDGDPDLVMSGWAWTGLANKPLTAVYRNDNGRFFYHSMPFGDQFAVSPGVAWGDVNNDGALDLFLMGGGEWGDNGAVVRSRWYENVGGVFSKDAFVDLRGMNEGDAALGDVDGDGDLDLVVTGAARISAQPTYWERSTMLFINQAR
jgi:hypothetical protein